MVRLYHIAIFLLVVAVLVYAFFRSGDFLQGPMVYIDSHMAYDPDDPLVTLAGSVENTVFLTVNDIRVYPQGDGSFTHDLLLPFGYTVIEFYAEDRQARSHRTYLPLIIKESYERN